PDDHDDVALDHRQIHALEDVQVPKPLVDFLQPDQGFLRAHRTSPSGRLGHPPAPAIPTRPLRSRFSAALTRRMSGSVTIRYAIAATVKKVALNVADAPSLAVVKMWYSLSTRPRPPTR